MKSDSPVTAVQIQQVAELLGLAVLRWQPETERSEKVSNSLPGRLEFSPETSLSVTGRSDPATCSVVAGSECKTESERLELRTTKKHRDADLCPIAVGRFGSQGIPVDEPRRAAHGRLPVPLPAIRFRRDSYYQPAR
jgi:hypothetical protein